MVHPERNAAFQYSHKHCYQHFTTIRLAVFDDLISSSYSQPLNLQKWKFVFEMVSGRCIFSTVLVQRDLLLWQAYPLFLPPSPPLSSKKKHCVIYGKWTECMWSVDPQAYEAHKKAEKKGDSKKHKNVSSVCVAAARVWDFLVLSGGFFYPPPTVFETTMFTPPYFFPPCWFIRFGLDGKLPSGASDGGALLVQHQRGFCVRFVETSAFGECTLHPQSKG